MRRLIPFAAALLLSLPAWAGGASIPGVPQLGATGSAIGFPPTSGGGGGCSQAIAYLSGKSYSAGQQTAITTFICSEVTNGNWAHLSMFAAAFGGSANDVYNWVSNTAMTFHGTITRNSPGWTGDGTTGYVDTGLVVGVSSPMGTNSASVGACVVNSRTTGNNSVTIGVADVGAGATTLIQPYSASNANGYTILGNFQSATAAANAQGSWAVQRSASTGFSLFLNGTSVGSATNTSIAGSSEHLYLLAYDSSGSASNFSADEVGYAFLGDGSVNVAALYADAHTLWTSAAVGGSGC